MTTTVVFSTTQLPPNLDGTAKLAYWRDLYAQNVVSYDVSYSDKPFNASFESKTLNAVTVCRVKGTIDRTIRARRHIAADLRDEFMIGFNESATDISMTQRGREALIGRGRALFFTSAENFDYRAKEESAWTGICLPRAYLKNLVRNVDDLVLQRMISNPETLRHLRHYIRSLLQSNFDQEPGTIGTTIETTLVDLVALSLGASSDACELASTRGLKEARLRQAVATIGHCFANCSFSCVSLARQVGVSTRYIQSLFEEVGTSFSEKVMELRMQKAKKMLEDEFCDDLRISDIAFECGFSDISHFNRSFRARFDCTPTQFRHARHKAF